jgi:hypothetical protein
VVERAAYGRTLRLRRVLTEFLGRFICLQGRQRGRDGDEDKKDQMEDYVDGFCDRLVCGVV